MSTAGSPTGASPPGSTGNISGCDRALSVTLPAAAAEEAGAILMDAFGPFEEIGGAGPGRDADEVTLVFYTGSGAERSAEILSLLPPALQEPGMVRVEASEVARDWVDGWKAHFQPILIDLVRIRPPWESPLDTPPAGLVEVVINPGLGFGTGLHPTTRGTLRLLQEAESALGEPTITAGVGGRAAGGRGRLLDAGTGSGVLAIAAAKLGWGPIVAFDNDPVALVSARENVEVNGVAAVVELQEAGVGQIVPEWSDEATVLANMTLEPVLALLERLAAAGSAGRPRRLVVSGILAGAQEQELLRAALDAGFVSGQRVYETEWVSLELLPTASRPTDPGVTDGAQTEES